MQTEHEARFRATDVEAILGNLSATCVVPRTLVHRVAFSNSDIEACGGWLRPDIWPEPAPTRGHFSAVAGRL